MLEYRIQRAWEFYKPDFGLGRLALLICFFNTLLFFLSGVIFKHFVLIALFPVPVSLLFFYYRRKIIKLGDHTILIFNTVMLALPIMLNYILVGLFDRNYGMLTRLDSFFHQFDLLIFNMPVAHWLFLKLGAWKFIYDFCMFTYLLYYILPIVGGLIYYFFLPVHFRYRIGRYFFSILIYFNLNYLIYLAIPVTGPQFFIKDFWNYPLPFGGIGQIFYDLVQNGQGTFIDCFPSGHAGVSFLVMLWMFRIGHKFKFVFMFIFMGILLATMLMRYHYTLDLLAGLLMAILAYALAFLFFPVKNERTKFIGR